jgi:hypothetical protein
MKEMILIKNIHNHSLPSFYDVLVTEQKDDICHYLLTDEYEIAKNHKSHLNKIIIHLNHFGNIKSYKPQDEIERFIINSHDTDILSKYMTVMVKNIMKYDKGYPL